MGTCGEHIALDSASRTEKDVCETFAYSGTMCSVDDTRCRDPTSVGT